AILENGARAIYQFSAVSPFVQETSITLYGCDGVLTYDLVTDQIAGASRRRGAKPGASAALQPIEIPGEKAGGWRVEAEFVEAIRGGAAVRFTDFQSGVRY